MPKSILYNISLCLVISFFLFICSCTKPALKKNETFHNAVDSLSKRDYLPEVLDSLIFDSIPDIITDEFHEFPLLDLKKHLKTNLNPDSLKWSFRQAKNLNIFLDEKRRILILRNKPDWTGTETVKFKVISTNHDSAETSIDFIVNSLPVLSDIPDQVIGKNMNFNKIKLNLYLKDKNNKSSEIRWEISGAKNVKITIDHKNQAKINPIDSNWLGSDTVIFRAYDPYNAMTGDAVVFSVDSNYSIYSMQPNLYLKSAGTLTKLQNGEQHLINNVHIEYKKNYNIKCDTAIVNNEMTEAKLFGNVFIWDTLRTVSAKRAEIFKESEKNRIFLYDNVKIDQDSIRIFGKSATFLQQFNSATVEENVKVEYVKFPTILKSRNLAYNLKSKDLFASLVESVTTVDSLYRYQLFTSSISYNDSLQLLKLNTNFTINAKKLAKEIVDFTINKYLNFASLFEQPVIASFDGFTLSALKGEYNLKDEKAWLWHNCKMTAIENNGIDTTVLFADTAFYDTKNRRLDLFGNVKIIKDTLRANSNFAVYYQDEKLIKLSENPEMFFGSSYMKGDSVDIFFNKDATTRYPEKAIIRGNGYLENSAKTALESEKNNLKGEQIELFFKKNQLEYVKAFGQVTSLFYNKEEDKREKSDSTDSTAVQTPETLKEAAGANQVTGDTLFVKLLENKVNSIHFKGGCEGTYYPRKFKSLIKK